MPPSLTLSCCSKSAYQRRAIALRVWFSQLCDRMEMFSDCLLDQPFSIFGACSSVLCSKLYRLQRMALLSTPSTLQPLDQFLNLSRDPGSGHGANASRVRQHHSSTRLAAPSLRHPD